MNCFKSLILLTVLGVLLSVGTSMYVNNDENTTNANGSQNENQDVTNSDADIPDYVIDTLPQDFNDSSDGENRTRDENTANANESQNENQDVTNSDADIPDYVIDTLPQDFIHSIDGENRTRELEKLAAGNRRKRAVSCDKAGVLRMILFYDDAFLSRFGNNADAEERLRAVFGHMQTFMELDSLSVNVRGVVIDSFRLELVEMKHLSGQTLRASLASLRALRDYVRDEVRAGDLRADIHAYMLFSSENDQGGAVGIAWLGTTCRCGSSLILRTSMVEYFANDVMTAETAVHELAHNLAAKHDFDGWPSNSRYDSNGNLCTGIGGVMDYYNTADKWTTCSNEDIGNYLSGLLFLCFPVEDKCPTTTTAAPAPTTTLENNPGCSCEMKGENKRRKCCKAAIKAGSCCNGCDRWC